MEKNIPQYYQQLIKQEKLKLPVIKKKIFLIAILRMFVILSGITAMYYFWEYTTVTIICALATIIIFLLLLKYHEKKFYEKKYSETLINLSENEIKAQNNDYSPFCGASDKIQPEHSFSYDLDLFGERSFFQSINRTVTSFGKDFLAKHLSQPLKTSEEILKYQKAIQELSAKQELINHFRVTGSISQKEDMNIHKFSESFTHKPLLNKNIFWVGLTYLIPCLYLLLLILCIVKFTSYVYFLPLWLITFTLNSLAIKKVNSILNIFEKRTDVLSSYISLFKIIENEKFESLLLLQNQQQLLKNTATSKAVQKLAKLCSNLNMGSSYPVILFFNPVLFWNVRYAIGIEKWLEKYNPSVLHWFNSLAMFDALSSLSVFAFTHPKYTFPVPNENHFIFTGKQLGHPLIPENSCVRNDVIMNKESYFLVITGANMAGKSTYLRTIGINYVLACCGAPVCAESLEFYPGNLVTNLRTTDSLADNESYFFSELKRLKMIIDRLQKGEKLFIILDEILKGTNSEDKQKGSLALIKQLISLKGNGIIATHDLVLGTLEKEYPANIKNYCFEADISNNKLSFTYEMREGVAQNMNACFLMKKMGITGL